MMRKKKRNPFPKIYLGLILLLMYYPIAIVVVMSFNASKLSVSWDGFSISWYQELFADRSIWQALGNSVILASISSCLAALIGTLGAVGISRRRNKATASLEYVSSLPIMVPEIVLGIVFLLFFALLRIPDGMLSLVLAHTSFCTPYIYMQVKSRLVGMDPSLREAAIDLGASEWTAFRSVTLPSLIPAISSGMILAFSMSLDDVIISSFLTSATVNTLPNKLYNSRSSISPKYYALCTLMFAFTLFMVLISILVGKIRENSAKQKTI